ncbi:chaperone NapD [Cereibacter sediminicola]|uniref:chaperone NapD n=1 Tax=Cereibacter sediminicola TaxID=2584941 RepID=UPI0011A13FA5|nr:chaperone NapD [Cereibacter sediminicola]
MSRFAAPVQSERGPGPGQGRRPQAHISSALLRVRPGREQAVMRRVLSIPGCAVALVQEGRLVVLIRSENRSATATTLATLTRLADVEATSLLYEQVE